MSIQTHLRSAPSLSTQSQKFDPDILHIDIIRLRISSIAWIDWLVSQRYACGHRGSLVYHLRIQAYGELDEIQCESKCPECAAKEIYELHARCTFCKGIIYPGSSVWVSQTTEAAKHFPARTAFLRGKSGTATINCVRMDCGGVGNTGHWTGREYIHDSDASKHPTFLVHQ